MDSEEGKVCDNRLSGCSIVVSCTTRPLDCETATTIVSLSVGVKVHRNQHDGQPRFWVLKNTCCATIACRGYSIGRLTQLCHYDRESADAIDALRVETYAEQGRPYHLAE